MVSKEAMTITVLLILILILISGTLNTGISIIIHPLSKISLPFLGMSLLVIHVHPTSKRDQHLIPNLECVFELEHDYLSYHSGGHCPSLPSLDLWHCSTININVTICYLQSGKTGGNSLTSDNVRCEFFQAAAAWVTS
jgi:hypothetical protein